jgi:hypothetical protein
MTTRTQAEARKSVEIEGRLYAGKPRTVEELAELAKVSDREGIRGMVARAVAAGRLVLLM